MKPTRYCTTTRGQIAKNAPFNINQSCQYTTSHTANICYTRKRIATENCGISCAEDLSSEETKQQWQWTKMSKNTIDFPCRQDKQSSIYIRSDVFWKLNSLPSLMRDSTMSLNTFKRRLKTYLFAAWWTPSGTDAAFLRVWRRYMRLFTYLLTYFKQKGRQRKVGNIQNQTICTTLNAFFTENYIWSIGNNRVHGPWLLITNMDRVNTGIVCMPMGLVAVA